MRHLLGFVAAGAGISLVTLIIGTHNLVPEVFVRPVLWPIYVVLVRGTSILDVFGAGRSGSPAWWVIALLLNSVYVGGVLWLVVRGTKAARRQFEDKTV